MAMTRMEGNMIEKRSAQHDTVQTSEKGRSSIVEMYSQGHFGRGNDDDEDKGMAAILGWVPEVRKGGVDRCHQPALWRQDETEGHAGSRSRNRVRQDVEEPEGRGTR